MRPAQSKASHGPAASPLTVDSNAPAPFPDPIPHIMPFGSICTLSGETGVGKNAMSSEWVARWQTGRAICGHPTNVPTEIGMLAGDRGWRTAQTWLNVAGAAPIKHVCIRDDPNFSWSALRDWKRVPEVFKILLNRLELGPGGLLIIDPLALFLPGRVNDYKDMAIALGTLDQIIRPFQLTTLGIFHQSKQLSDNRKTYVRPQDRILGSAAQIGFSDTSMFLLSPSDMDIPFYGFGWVPHNAPAETRYFTRDTKGLFVPAESPELTEEPLPAELDPCLKVLELIPTGPPNQTGPANRTEIPTVDLIKTAITTLQISQPTVYRRLTELKERQLVGMAAGKIWRRKPS